MEKVMEISEPIMINKKYYPIPEDLETLKEIEKHLIYINQPINSRLSSLLQVVCVNTRNPKLVEYLLKQQANPYYMDINGYTAFDYALENKVGLKDWLFILLGKYQHRFKQRDMTERKEFVYHLIQSEIIKYELQKRESEALLLQELEELEIPDDE